MKFLCIKENLNKGLQILGNTPTQDAALPVLANVLLKTENGQLKLSATDLEVGINCFVSGKIEQEGSITIPAKLLMQYVSSIRDEKLGLSCTDLVLSVSSANNSTTFSGISPEEFPLIPEIKDGTSFEVDCRILLEAIKKTVFAVANDFSRPEIAGVYFALEGDQLVLASTDSYRLAEFRYKLPVASKTKIAMIIPAKTMRALERVLSEKEGSVKIRATENQVMFSFEDVIITSRLVDGKFPDYIQIIPASSTTSVFVERGVLINTIKTTSLFSKAGVSDIKIETDLESNTLKISAATESIGKSEAKIPCKNKGENTEITFNYKYLLEGLSVIDEEIVELGISGNSMPGMIRGEGDKSYIYIIMPIKQ